ncbi:glycerophosphodiester phosphodiesterase family protein [Sorangium sp. So ce363]|uniref:glycerophosphodiester phosphodiesterase family protein n=1 Tax=Sorangium sp. So ce363 TaxID=3133304 RepID=UPI003F5FDDA0
MSSRRHPLLSEGFRIIAYRGGAAEQPENTLEAFQHAASLASDVVIELDVQRTADGVLVAHHDEDTWRTTGARGRVAELPYPELARLDAGFAFEAGGRHPQRGRGVRIPTVDDALASFPRHPFVLDVHATHPQIAADVAALVARHDAASRVVIASEAPRVVAAIRSARPGWLFAGTSREVLLRVLLERARLDALAPRTGGVLMIPERHGALQVLSRRGLRQAHARGERVWVWVVERVEDLARLRDLGVDGVFTPRPAAFAAAHAALADRPR